MTVELITEEPRWDALDLETLATRACAAALDFLGLNAEDWEISLLACDNARIAVLNADHRGKPSATNVLSWPSDERAAAQDGGQPQPPEGPDPELGDIAIAYETCAREAEDAGKSMHDHVTHLLVHGVLHLLGYDHIRDLDATLMEGLETQILGKMGLSDPYRNDAG